MARAVHMYINKKTLLLLAILFAIPAFCDERPWREIRSPHFRVITNGSESAGRHVAREFEQMRGVFAARFPTFRLDPVAPLLILAPLDEPTTKKLLPEFWATRISKPAGVYFHGWERQFAVIRLDAVGSDRITPDMYAVVYHEYVHSLLHLNFRWLPTWLDEGLAEFYAYTRFEGDKTYIGAPPKNIGIIRALDARASIPLEKFLTQRGSFSRDDRDTEMFYAQSWALTHYLTMGPGMENGNHLVRFFNALQAGTEQKKAFQDAFGPYDQVQKDFDAYTRRFAFPAGVIPSPPQTEDKSYESRMLTVPETETELAAFYAGTHHLKVARESADKAVKEEPKLALAHETLGFLDLDDGKDQEAVREFSQAVDLDSKMYLSLFAKTMLSPLSHSAVEADRNSYRAELSKVLNVNPQFAPAFVELGRLSIAEGNLTRALALSRTAEKFEPSRAGYHVMSGQILLRLAHPGDAAAQAAYVANRWTGADQDEALELWNRVPAAQRPAESVPDRPAEKEVMHMEGVVKSVTCSEQGIMLTIDQAGQSLNFHFQRGSMGFSDTLWVGEHFTPCHHASGLRAVVRYKPAADKSVAGEAMSIGFRDDLPFSIVAAGSSQSSPQNSPADSK
jgi:Tfp pilus assembly protein PilF